MFFIAVLVVCYSADHCELRMPPGDDLTWPTVEECSDYGERLEANARLTLAGRGVDTTHIKWWCIPVAEELAETEDAPL